MRRRQTAAPTLDVVDTALAETTDAQPELLVSGSEANDSSQSDASALIVTPTETGEEPAPAKPRRTRRPKAVAVAEETIAPPENATDPTTVGVTETTAPETEAVPDPPKRTRRPRRPATEPEAVVVAPSETETPDREPVAAAESNEPPVEPSLFDTDAETPATDDAQFTSAREEDPSFAVLLAESEAILEEVIGETAPAEKSPRSRRNNRRGRGQGRGPDNTEGGSVAPPVIAAGSGPFRKRGPRVLARTLPLPALPPSSDPEILATDVLPGDQSAPTRKRGIRIPPTSRRILTADGVTVVTVAQAASLLGSVLVVADETGDNLAAPILPLFAPVVPQYTPLSPETLERLPQVAVAHNNGVPELLVNGSPVLPAFLFVNTEVADEPEVAREIAVRQIKRAYASGVRLFTLLAHLPWKRKAGDRRFESLDDAFALVAEVAPDALVLPRLIFSPPASWERANPDEMAAFANGEFGDVSIGSELFWNEEAKDALRAAIEHLAEGEHAGRTLGVYLEHGEWFQSKGVGADRSPANTASFRAWLKYQYRNNEVALRSAWYDGTVTFESAEIPSPEQFAAAASQTGTQPVFLGDRETRLADFYAYTSTITADRIMQLGAITKEASAGRLAVAASYGYTLEIARPNCGHYALGDVLSSPYVDIFTAPLSYSGRLPGGSAPFPVPVDSIHLAGKLFVAEDDTKTHLALRPTEDVYNPKIATEEGTRAVHARNVGTVLAKGCGISWMDLWGEGWLDDDATWEHLGGLLGLMGTVADMRRTASDAVSAPQVAVFVDEQSLFDMSGDEEPLILPQLIGKHRDVFARAGASVGFYLLSDLLKPEFPTSARLFIFLNAFHLPVAIRTALQNRWQNDGRTFAWLFAPGVREAGNIAELSETIGIQLRLQPWGSRTGTLVTEGRFPLTENAKGERFGEDKRVNPSLTVVDPKAQVLGEYVSSGNPSLAYRKHARWQSVFIGERELPLPLVRGLYRLAGVPVVTPDDDVVQIAGDGFTSVHSSQSGGMTLYSPTRRELAVYDAVSGEPLGGSGYGVRLQTEARATRLVLWATPEDLSARFDIGTDTWESAPASLTEAELPARASAFVFESANSAPPGPVPQRGVSAEPQPTRLYPVELSVSAEDIAQFEAALAGEIALLEKEGDASTESEATRKKRRRRRRGGRGEKGATDAAETDEVAEEEEGEGGEGEIDSEAADAVFALADLSQGTTGFDADALLPLLSFEEGEIPDADDPADAIPESAGDVPFDPVADMMARLFAQPGRIGEGTDAPAASELPTSRRPTLDELLPFSEAPIPDTEVPNEESFAVTDELLPAPTEIESVRVEGIEESTTVVSPTEEPVSGEVPENEAQPVGLLDSAVRGRRTRTAGAGGFTTRLRRRTPSDPPPGASVMPGGDQDETVSDEPGSGDEVVG